MNRKTSIIFFVCCVVIFVFYSLFNGNPKNDIDIGESSLSLYYKDFKATVEYEDVCALGLVELDDFGEVISGGANRSHRWGTWENQRFGEYTQYTVTATNSCVVLELKNGEYVLLSFEGKESTDILREALYDMLVSQGYQVEKFSDEVN